MNSLSVCLKGVWEGVGGFHGRKGSMEHTLLSKQSMSMHVTKGQ